MLARQLATTAQVGFGPGAKSMTRLPGRSRDHGGRRVGDPGRLAAGTLWRSGKQGLGLGASTAITKPATGSRGDCSFTVTSSTTCRSNRAIRSAWSADAASAYDASRLAFFGSEWFERRPVTVRSSTYRSSISTNSASCETQLTPRDHTFLTTR